MPLREVQCSKCPKFGKIKGKNPQLSPFYWTLLPFIGYATRMPLFSRISTETHNVTVNKIDKKLPLVK